MKGLKNIWSISLCGFHIFGYLMGVLISDKRGFFWTYCELLEAFKCYNKCNDSWDIGVANGNLDKKAGK